MPIEDNLTIELKVTEEGMYSVDLYNAIGQKIKQQRLQELEQGTHLLQVKHLADIAPGVYTLKVIGPSGKSIHSQQILTQ